MRLGEGQRQNEYQAGTTDFPKDKEEEKDEKKYGKKMMMN